MKCACMPEGGKRAAGLIAAALLMLCAPAAAWADDNDSFDADFGKSLAVPEANWEPSDNTGDGGKGDTKLPNADPEAVRKMVDYFLTMYSRHLESPDWIKRSMAVISLGRISDTRITDKLLDVAENDRSTAVRVFAWEAVHARNGLLTSEQRKRWIAAGEKMGAKGAFRGDLRVGLVYLLGEAEPTNETRKVFMRLFDRTNSLDPGDIPTLQAMGDLLARWRDRTLIAALIKRMSNLNDAYRAEYILTALNSGVKPSASLARKGSGPMWTRTRAAWAQWYGRQEFASSTGRPYRGKSNLLPPPESIIDTHAARWRKNLEVGGLHLDHFDVAFVIDSTGSMKQVVEWIQRDVTRMMRAFGKISREPRIGVTFYRDRGDEYVTRVYGLTGDGRRLAAAIAGVTAKGGGDVPEAVYEALRDTVRKQRWTRRDGAAKILVLVGDAEPHPESMDRIQKLVADAAARGFRFYCVKASTRYGSSDLSSFDRIAEWGKGASFDVWFPDSQPIAAAGRTRVAYRRRVERPYRQVVGEVLKSILSDGYQDRAQSFVDVLLEYLEQHVPEKRAAFGPAPPPRPRTSRGNDHDPRHERPRPPAKPYDPQAR